MPLLRNAFASATCLSIGGKFQVFPPVMGNNETLATRRHKSGSRQFPATLWHLQVSVGVASRCMERFVKSREVYFDLMQSFVRTYLVWCYLGVISSLTNECRLYPVCVLFFEMYPGVVFHGDHVVQLLWPFPELIVGRPFDGWSYNLDAQHFQVDFTQQRCVRQG